MDEFITNIIKGSLYKINDVKEGVVQLTELQNKRAIKFLNELRKDIEKNNTTVCLRGENYFNLSEKLFHQNERVSNKFSSEFYRRCFLLGDKSKTNYLCSYNNNNPIPWSMDIGKVSPVDFEFIFYEMSYFVRGNNFNWNNDNSNFVEYFANNDNRSKFILLANKLTSSDQLLTRDYYCWLLHTAANQRFHSYSYYVSTTTDPEISDSYSNENGPVSILYFIPKPIYRFATSCETILKASKLLININLPVINSEVYPDEFEISIKGGLFPHFIIGFYEYENDKFVFNHHLFKNSNKSIKSIFKNGLEIDQSDFFEYIKKTSYHSGVAMFSDGRFSKIET